MISVNGKRINLKDDTDPFAKEIQAGFKKLRDIGFPLVLKFTPNHIQEKKGNDPDSREEHAQGVSVMNRIVEYTVDGENEWAYYTKVVKQKNDKPDLLEPRKTRITPHFVLNERDIELAFYLIFKSGKCEKHSLLAGMQNISNPGDIHFRLSVKAHEAELVAEARRLQSKINSLLYDKEFGIGLSDDDIVIFAEQIGMRNAKAEDSTVLRNNIYSWVMNPKNKADRDKFIEFAQKDKKEDITAIVTIGINSGKIVVEEAGNSKNILWDSVPADEPRKITSCGKTKDTVKELVKYLETEGNEELKESFLKTLTFKLQPASV